MAGFLPSPPPGFPTTALAWPPLRTRAQRRLYHANAGTMHAATRRLVADRIPDTAGETPARGRAPRRAVGTSLAPTLRPAPTGAGDRRYREEVRLLGDEPDPKTGHLTVKTAEGNLSLHFPPSALDNVKKGDRVSVELGLKPMGSASSGSMPPSASPKTGKSHDGTSSSGSAMPGGSSSGGEKKY
jgi:hypothetical protein